MKKIIVFLLCLTLLVGAICPINALAADPSRSVPKPTIESEMPDCYGYIGESSIELFTNATSPNGGKLEYQWYSTTVRNMSSIRAISRATRTSYTVPEVPGVVYYCYAVWNVQSNGEKSSPVYSRLIRVEYEEREPTVESIEVLQAPNKTTYTSGECLNLKGLVVRVNMSNGSSFESKNGDKLTITKKPLVTVGEQKIKVTYGDASDIFIVTVKAATHTHSFSKWQVVTKPTCTKGGIKMRECDCGETERENVPATGHQWDDGKVTKQPTEAAAGEKTYTCQSCKTTKKEAIVALDSAAPAESSVSTDLGSAFNSTVEVGNMQDSENSSVAENVQEPESSISDADNAQVEEQSDGHGALILIIVLIIAAVVLIGIGIAVVCIVLIIKKSKKA